MQRRIIGGRGPNEYEPRLMARNGRLEESLRTHFVDPDLLEAGNFGEYFRERGVQMLNLIGRAMGKNIPDGEAVFESALDRYMPEKYWKKDEPADAGDQPDLDEFDDGEPEYDDDIGSAAREPDGDDV